MKGLYSVCARISRQHSCVDLGTRVANQSRNEYYKLYDMIKARYMTGFWNVIKRRRSLQVKSSLTASDFNSFYGDIMQALPDSSHDQTCDKKIVDTY